MASIFLDSVSKRFPDGTDAVKDLSLEIKDREFVVLVGPSGCGKSTTLRLIAGLETLSSGEIRIGDRDVSQLPVRDRDIAMVFQDDALYPHMSVYGNLSFGLKLRYGGGVIASGLRRIFQPARYRELSSLRRGIDEKVRQAADRLAITGLLNQRPHQLSGGERHRVALGRALVREPAAFLLDEPLSSLDAVLRRELRIELKRLHHEFGATILYVTHDQVEAMTLGDRVAVMNGGKILQVGSPLEVYQRPANLFVAQFIGNTPMNLIPGTVQRSGAEIEFASTAMTIGISSNEVPVDQLSGEVWLGFRAEHGLIRLAGDSESSSSDIASQKVVLPGLTISEIERLGDLSLVYVSISGDQSSSNGLAVKAAADVDWKIGDSVDVVVDPAKLVWFDQETEDRIDLR
jgi:ABC-type sugar transport system ATPase subunit